jgi:hypothetical protein
MNAATKSLLERIEALPPEKKAEVEDFVEFLARRTKTSEMAHTPAAKTFPDDLLERINQRRERLFREHGSFDTLTILQELRESGPR